MHPYLGDFALFIQCNRGRSLDEFFDDVVLQPDSVKIGLIGCGCSVATEPVAEISHKWNISQVPYTYKVCYRFKSPLSYIITSKMIYHRGEPERACIADLMFCHGTQTTQYLSLCTVP